MLNSTDLDKQILNRKQWFREKKLRIFCWFILETYDLLFFFLRK